MSLAALGGMGTGALAQHQMPGMGMGHDHSHSHDHGGVPCNHSHGPTIQAQADGEVTRGGLTGESCITLDLTTDLVRSACWSEKASTCDVCATSTTRVDIGSMADLTKCYTELIEASVQADEAMKATVDNNKLKAPKKKRTLERMSALTLVVPGNWSTNQLRTAVKAAADAKLVVKGSGKLSDVKIGIKNVFTRSVASLVGAMNRLQEEPEEGHDDSDVFLYVHARGDYLEAAILDAEGKKSAKYQGNRLGYERISIRAQICKTNNAMHNTRSTLSGILQEAGVATVRATINDGLDSSSLGNFFGREIKTVITDAVQGGCLLTAAELTSSKAYIHNDSGSKISFLLPVADGFLHRDLAVRTDTCGSDGQTTSNIEHLFKGGLRLPKLSFGPIHPTSKSGRTLPKLSREFHFDVACKVTFIERVNGDQWEDIETIQPLLSGTGDEVVSCDMVYRLDVAIGFARAEMRYGKKVSDMKKTRSMFMYVILVFLSCVGIYFAQQHVVQTWDNAILEADVEWLRGVYQEVNPTKLASSPDWPRLMVRKYKKNIWVLHRKISKEYDVSIKKPPSIDPDL